MHTLVVGHTDKPSVHYKHENHVALATTAAVLARNDTTIDMLLILDSNQNVMTSMVREGVDNWKTTQYTVSKTGMATKD